MATAGFFDFQDPFGIMVGLWNGMTTTYDEKGHYQNSVASLVRVSWVRKGKTLRYQQEELANLDQVLAGNPHKDILASIISHDFDMAVKGKACQSTNTHKEKMSMKGVETQPGTYLFHLNFPQGDYYNTQAQGIYSAGPSERYGLYARYTADLEHNIRTTLLLPASTGTAESALAILASMAIMRGRGV